MPYDVIVIGGSYAGMAAALQLLRARRSVLIIDAGKRRNRAAAHSHGLLTRDGEDPAEIARIGREQLAAYPTLTWIDGTATKAETAVDGFAVTTEDGTRHEARRLIFAVGVSDTLPAIDGLEERFGRSVFLCPYCHGYEMNMGRIGVIAVTPQQVQHASLLKEWGEVTILTSDAFHVEKAELEAQGFTVETGAIERLEGEADVRLADGRLLEFAGIFTAARNAPSTPLAEALGCGLTETPFGMHILTRPDKQTTIPGVFACGDAGMVPHSLSLAIGDGAMAGAGTHRSLVFGL
jgi:thioredoxin reductase